VIHTSTKYYALDSTNIVILALRSKLRSMFCMIIVYYLSTSELLNMHSAF